MLLTSQNETFKIILYKRQDNSPYEYENSPAIIFKGRTANNQERRSYRLQKGVNANSESVYLFITRLPVEVEPKDKIVFMGKEWLVESVGFYYNDSRIINNSIMSEEYIKRRCPKGITLV